MEENTDIFICCHKQSPTINLTNPCYKIISGPNRIDSSLEQLNVIEKSWIKNMNQCYCETSRIWWVYKNFKLKKYVGFCHYRRFFDFLDNVPNMDEIFKEYNILTFRGSGNKTIEEGYQFHSLQNMQTVDLIIKKKYPNLYEEWQTYLHQNIFIGCNMFITRSELFKEMADFVFSVMEIYDQLYDFKSSQDVEEYCRSNIDTFGFKSVDYQKRMQGFLCERLFNFYYLHLGKIHYCNLIEKKL